MKTTLIMTAAALALALSGTANLASAQSAKAHKAAKGELASAAQLQREHDRAIKAGDAANDPFDSSSSDALNRAQLQGLPPATGLKTTVDSSTDASTTGAGEAMTATGEAVTPGDATATGEATTSTDATTDTTATTPTATEQPMDAKAQSAPPVLPDTNPAATNDDTGKAGSNGNPTDAPDKPQGQ